MPTVAVTPSSLREAAEDLVVTRTEDLDGSRNLDVLHGYEDDQYISTGGFPMGVKCQDRLTALFGQACQAYGRVYQDLFGLASALYIVADLFGSADADQAALLEFAFAASGAKVPAGLPEWIDPEQTGHELAREMRRQHQLDMALNEDGVLPAGWSEETFPLYPGSAITVTEIRDADGKLVIRRQSSTSADGTNYVVTTGYDEDGNRIREQVTNRSMDGGESAVTKRYDEDGNVVGLEERTQDPGGGWVSTVYDPDDPDVVVSRTTHTLTERGGWTTVEQERNASGELVMTGQRVRDVAEDGSVQYDSYEYKNGEVDKHVNEWEVGAQPLAMDYQDSQSHYMDQINSRSGWTQEDHERYAEYQQQVAEVALDGTGPSGVTPGQHQEVPWEVVGWDGTPAGNVPIREDIGWGGTHDGGWHVFDDEVIEDHQEHHNAPDSF